jgi:hypothetical protein
MSKQKRSYSKPSVGLMHSEAFSGLIDRASKYSKIIFTAGIISLLVSLYGFKQVSDSNSRLKIASYITDLIDESELLEKTLSSLNLSTEDPQVELQKLKYELEAELENIRILNSEFTGSLGLSKNSIDEAIKSRSDTIQGNIEILEKDMETLSSIDANSRKIRVNAFLLVGESYDSESIDDSVVYKDVQFLASFNSVVHDIVTRKRFYSFGFYLFLCVGSLLILELAVVESCKLNNLWKAEITSNQKKIDEAQQRINQNADDASPAWEMARETLKEYYTRNLYQVRMIFIASVVAMSGGFLLICLCIVFGFFFETDPKSIGEIVVNVDAKSSGSTNTEAADSNNLAEPTTKELKTTGYSSGKERVAMFGVIAGVITNFIGATFLFLYQSTIKQASKYAQSLEHINSVGMSMYILDSLKKHQSPETQIGIVEAKVEIAKLILSREIYKNQNADSSDSSN